MVNWDDLRYLLAVQRAGSLNAAARGLGVDKATVSRRVAALEAAIGVRLFDRKPHGYGLTSHGERVVAASAQVDDAVAGVLSDLSAARGDGTGLVHLTVPQFFASRVLWPALPGFCAAHPGIDLVVNASSSVLNVARREAEVGLRNVKPKQLSVTVRRVGRLGMALYASQKYLDRRGAPRAARDLSRHDLVGWENRFTHAQAFLWANECAARIPLRVNDAGVMSDAVAAGMGIAALPCLLGDEQGLVRIEAFGVGHDDIYAVAPGELRRSLRVRAVLDFIAATWAANERRLAGSAAATAAVRVAPPRPRRRRRAAA